MSKKIGADPIAHILIVLFLFHAYDTTKSRKISWGVGGVRGYLAWFFYLCCPVFYLSIFMFLFISAYFDLLSNLSLLIIKYLLFTCYDNVGYL